VHPHFGNFVAELNMMSFAFVRITVMGFPWFWRMASTVQFSFVQFHTLAL